MDQTPSEQASLEAARDLVAKEPFNSLPVDIERIAKHLGVTEIAARDMGPDGYLGMDARGEYVIRYRSVNGRQRNRFTIAHELGHLLLLRHSQASSNETETHSEREERFVNRIASELLMPERAMLSELRKCFALGANPGWETLLHLCQRFDVSLAAVAIRILELPSIAAASLSIGIEGPGPSRPFRASVNQSIRLVNGVDFESDRIWRESRRSSRHELLVHTGQVERRIACEGRVHTLGRGNRRLQQYWVIGWTEINRE